HRTRQAPTLCAQAGTSSVTADRLQAERPKAPSVFRTHGQTAPVSPGVRPRLITDQENLPGSRLLDANFTAVQQAAGTPKGRPAGAQYLCAFIEDIKATGLVARTIAKHNVRGLTVAPKA